jgi:hypothetical protein
MHSHDFVEVFFVLSGNFEVTIGDGKMRWIEVSAGDLVEVTAKTSDSLEHKLYKVGSLIFAYGKEQRALVLNPFDDIDRPEVAYTVPEILEPARFKKLLATAENEVPELIPFLAMAGFAGLRRSELVRE